MHIVGVRCISTLQRCLSHGCCKLSAAVIRVLKNMDRNMLTFIVFYIAIGGIHFTYSISFTNSFDIKSNASLEMVENVSSSKSYLPIVTFAIVVISVEPINGDKPDSLRIK